jgi:hypothetical protein
MKKVIEACRSWFSVICESVIFFILIHYRNPRLCWVPHSVKLGSRQRASLPSAGNSAQGATRQRHVCRVFNTRQRRRSAKGRQRPSQSWRPSVFAESRRLALGKESSLPSAIYRALGKGRFAECLIKTLNKVYFYFFDFVSQTFCGMFLHCVYLHVSFVDNYNRVLNR